VSVLFNSAPPRAHLPKGLTRGTLTLTLTAVVGRNNVPPVCSSTIFGSGMQHPPKGLIRKRQWYVVYGLPISLLIFNKTVRGGNGEEVAVRIFVSSSCHAKRALLRATWCLASNPHSVLSLTTLTPLPCTTETVHNSNTVRYAPSAVRRTSIGCSTPSGARCAPGSCSRSSTSRRAWRRDCARRAAGRAARQSAAPGSRGCPAGARAGLDGAQ
jgi:hypothetical protein